MGNENECKSFIRKFLKLFFSERRKRKFQGCFMFVIRFTSTLLQLCLMLSESMAFRHIRKSINDIHFRRQNFQVFLMLIISHCFSRMFVRFSIFPPFLCVWPISCSLSPLSTSLVTKSPETINAKHKSFISSAAYQFSIWFFFFSSSIMTWILISIPWNGPGGHDKICFRD